MACARKACVQEKGRLTIHINLVLGKGGGEGRSGCRTKVGRLSAGKEGQRGTSAATRSHRKMGTDMHLGGQGRVVEGLSKSSILHLRGGGGKEIRCSKGRWSPQKSCRWGGGRKGGQPAIG